MVMVAVMVISWKPPTYVWVSCFFFGASFSFPRHADGHTDGLCQVYARQHLEGPLELIVHCIP